MSDTPILTALDRLERALDRVEKAAVARSGASDRVAAAHAALDSRHTRLRERIQQTIGELDRLIAAEGPRG